MNSEQFKALTEAERLQAFATMPELITHAVLGAFGVGLVVGFVIGAHLFYKAGKNDRD